MSMKSFIVMLSGWFILRLELILNCKALVKIVYNVVLVTENIPLICLGRCWQVLLGVRNGLEMEQFGVELRRVVDRPSLS